MRFCCAYINIIMTKQELFAVVLDIVAYETDISINDISQNCRNAEIVDARHIAVILLSRYGVTYTRIAKLLNISPRYVNKIITCFDNRLKFNKPLSLTYKRCLSRLSRVVDEDSG